MYEMSSKPLRKLPEMGADFRRSKIRRDPGDVSLATAGLVEDVYRLKRTVFWMAFGLAFTSIMVALVCFRMAGWV